ncbi:MAG: MFS transporter [Mycobacterium leprae]
MSIAATITPLRHRDFRLFWLGQWVSQFGDNVFLVALNWTVWKLTGSGAAMATVTLCSQVPSIGMLLVGGALVDRFPRRRISILSDVVRGVALLAAGSLALSGLLQLWHLYVIAVLLGLASAFARPAFRALTQALTPSGEGVAANGLIASGRTTAGIAGPALGGLLMGFGGAASAFLFDGLSFFIAAAALLGASPQEPAVARQGKALRIRTLVTDLAAALRILSARPVLILTIGVLSLIVVTGQAPIVILRPWVASQVGGGVHTLSVAYSLFAAGMFLTVTALGSVSTRGHEGWLIYGGFLLSGLCQVGMALAKAPWQMWSLDFLTGVSVMAYGVIWPALLQETVPPDAMGRVSAVDDFGSLILYPAGIVLTGILSTRPGAYWVLLGGGLLTMGIALIALVTLNGSLSASRRVE